jgi:glycosyltransferase involved in cell wall biosynthesis
VVAYDVRGVREVIGADTGVLVARGDRAALVDAVASLLEDEGRRRCLGDRARQRVSERYSEDGVFERLRRVYRELPAR